MRLQYALALMAGAATAATGQTVDPGALPISAEGQLTNFATTNAISVAQFGSNPPGGVIVSSDTYTIGGGWLDLVANSGARWGGAGSLDPYTATFNPAGGAEIYSGAPTQIGVDFNIVEFSSVSGTTGNSIAQVSVLSADGGAMDAVFAGLGGFGFGVGEGLFVGDPRDTLAVDAPGFNIVSVDFGFFNDGTFLGSGSAVDLSGPDGLAGVFVFDVGGSGLVFDEAFLNANPMPGKLAWLSASPIKARFLSSMKLPTKPDAAPNTATPKITTRVL